MAVASNTLGSMVGGVVGGEAGWKLSNEGMLAEEGVVIFVTHQNALVVCIHRMLNAFLLSMYRLMQVKLLCFHLR